MNKATRSGIYAITNTANGKVYVGSAVNIHGRWRVHLSDGCQESREERGLVAAAGIPAA